MQFIYFYIIYLIFLFSCIGHGIFFAKIFNFKNQINIGTYGLLGLTNLAFISYITVFFIQNKSFLNILIILLGLFFLFIFRNKLVIPKKFWLTLFVVSIALLISKTHDDFPFYHLQQSLNFSTNKIQIGLSNLDFSYAYHSSILYLNSLFYLPYFDYYFFNVPNLLFLFFSIIVLTNSCLDEKNINLIKFFSLFAVIFIIIKFSRLSEYGTDISGQILLTVVFYYLLKVIYSKKIKIDYLKIIVTFIIFSITIKTYFIFYSLLIFLVINILGYKKTFDLVKSNALFSFYIIIFISLFLTLNIFSSGCLIFPVAETCFDNLKWAMPINEIKDYNIWFQAWSKSLAGTGYVIKNYYSLVTDLGWIQIWYSNYFSKYLETIYLLIFITLLLILLFRPYKKEFNFSKFHFFLIIFLIFVAIFWFFKHPTLRYGGYFIHFSLFSLIISLILARSELSQKSIQKKISILIFISLSIFGLKNIDRIYSELDRKDEYSYRNFPFFFVKNVNYEKIYLNNDQIVTFIAGDVCWASPPPCGTNKNLTSDFLMNFVVFYRDKN